MVSIPSRRVSRFTLTLGVSLLSLLALPACISAQAERDESSEEEGESMVNEEGLTGSMPVGSILTTLANLNLRGEPSTAAKVLTVMPAGSKVTLQAPEPSNGFYQISYDGTIGWSSGQYLQPASSGAVGPATSTLTATGDVNLRSGPSTSYSVLTVVPLGSQVEVQKPDPVDGFYNIKYQSFTGWSSGKYLTPSSAPNPGGGGGGTPVANGTVWKFKAKTLPVDVAVFLPAAALGASEVEVLFYSHGLNVCSPVAKNPPISFVTDAPFNLAQIVEASQRSVVLVAPFFDWEHLAANGMAVGGSNHKLGIPKNLNGVVAEVLEQVGQHQNTTAPSLSSLMLAGHSRAYSFLNPLAAANADPEMSTGALAKLTHVWGLDSTYTCYPTKNWTDWMAKKPSLHVSFFYKAGTGTADCGKQFANLAPSSGGQLSVHVVPEAHCAVPATEIPILLDALP